MGKFSSILCKVPDHKQIDTLSRRKPFGLRVPEDAGLYRLVRRPDENEAILGASIRRPVCSDWLVGLVREIFLTDIQARLSQS